MRTLIFLASATTLAACSAINLGSPVSIFYKDGKPAYVATCTGPSSKSCLEQAGATCRTAGYTVLEKSAARSYGDETREIVFACNGDPDAPVAASKAGS